jgi:hypothetical protein
MPCPNEWIDKHIGDSVMAVFGAPVAARHEATRAVRAAAGSSTPWPPWVIPRDPLPCTSVSHLARSWRAVSVARVTEPIQ